MVMRKSGFNTRFVIFTSIGLAASLLTIIFYSFKADFFVSIDLKLKDVRFRTRGEVKPDHRVVVAAIDSKSVNELGRWPWDRKIVARLIENLKTYGAKTVALDIVFSEPSNAASDAALSTAMAKSGNVIAGYFFRHEEDGKKGESAELLKNSKIDNIRKGGSAKAMPAASFPNVETNIPAISKAAAGSGFFNIIPDKDGILRKSNLIMGYGDNLYSSLALSALRHYLNNPVVLDVAEYGIDELSVGNRRIPADEAGRFTVNYYGRQGVFRTISVADVVNNRLEKDALKDSIVFVGATEIGIADLRATPPDPVLPGVEAHASVVSNVFQEMFITRDGRVIALEIAVIILFPLGLTALLRIARRTMTGLAFFAGTVGIYFLANYFLFSGYSLDLSIIFPLAAIGLTYLGSEAYRNLIEEKHSRFLKKAFTSYVSPALVGEIMKNPDMLKLGGEKRNITVLFSDIRGFTTISEKLTPEALVQLLNQYLGPMTDIVLQHRGTLDKYIGDAIMALYNAPLDVEDHPLQACRSALVMIEKLKDLNSDFKANGLPEVDIGIGINTGDVIVGNMGTDVRFDYTAMGDTVNLSSRLEGMNKIYKTHIILTEFTLDKLKALGLLQQYAGELRLRELDFIKVKGKDKPVTIYELSAAMDSAAAKKFEEALALYRKQQFKEAKQIFEKLELERGDKTAGVFAERCAEFIENPPDPDWDGVYVAKTK
jgi:adenylate cyclase